MQRYAAAPRVVCELLSGAFKEHQELSTAKLWRMKTTDQGHGAVSSVPGLTQVLPFSTTTLWANLQVLSPLIHTGVRYTIADFAMPFLACSYRGPHCAQTHDLANQVHCESTCRVCLKYSVEQKGMCSPDSHFPGRFRDLAHKRFWKVETHACCARMQLPSRLDCCRQLLLVLQPLLGLN